MSSPSDFGDKEAGMSNDVERQGLLVPNNNNNDKREGGSAADSAGSQERLVPPRTPAQKVRYLLADEEDEDVQLGGFRPLFCQMNVLCRFDDGTTGWKESSRWLKYEERLDDGNRWSKPHVTTASLHSLFELRRGFGEGDGLVLLDLDVSHGCQHQAMDTKPAAAAEAGEGLRPLESVGPVPVRHVAELVVAALRAQRGLAEERAQDVLDALLRPHKHQHRGGRREAKDDKKLFATKPDKAYDRSYSYPGGVKPDTLSQHKPNKKFGKKLASGTEAANLLVGQLPYLNEPLLVLARLKQSSVLGDMTEVECPTRFLFIVLGPVNTSMTELEETGRAMASMFTDKVFCEVAYKARTPEDLVDGIDEFIDDLTVLPPSVWDPAMRLEPPQNAIPEEKVRKRLTDSARYQLGVEKTSIRGEEHEDPTLKRTGRLFGGMWNDMKRRYPQYLSDITDGINLQSIACIVFLYFACVTPIITFGGLMGSSTDNYMGTMESLLSGAICGLTYHTFSGQPLTIVGATGPLLVFESILYQLCKDYEWDFLSFRFYTGLWITIFLLLIVAFDLSAYVSYITRFTEESFSVLISLIFIAEAFKKAIGIWGYSPAHVGAATDPVGYTCHCVEPPFSNSSGPTTPAEPLNPGLTAAYNVTPKSMMGLLEKYNYTQLVMDDCVTIHDRLIVGSDCISVKSCLSGGWELMGPACEDAHVTHGVPDVFLFSFMLFLATFGIAYTLRTFRNMSFFPTFVRNTVADFAVLIAILICVGSDYAFGIDTPKLAVPTEFKTSRDDRDWVVDLGAVTYWWLIPLSFIPAFLATILIFLDQQISAVIVNRKDHKLKKGHGYHLDLFVLSVIVFICSILGLPWFVAATVRSITHVKALLKQSEHRAPGEKPQFLGVREQRFTGICIHILIGASVLLTTVLKFVPMPVLYGVFLYMGVTSLSGVQFVDRILLLFQPSKYQPDFVYLRHVPIRKVHLYTAVQILCMAIMWTLKSIKAISITFPLMILALCFIRKALEWFFTPTDMFWLDHLLPEVTRRKKEDEMLDGIDSKEAETTMVELKNSKAEHAL